MRSATSELSTSDSLNRYLDQTFRERIRRLDHSLPPRDAIIAFLQEIIKRSE
jgi:TetR/AcrR family transcriptional regulator, transcriptional repressor for nem operon